jgi:DNA-binding transcriptional LysR family regulator
LASEVIVQLLIRQPRGLSVTPAGEQVLRHADAVLDRLDEAERELGDLSAAATATVRLAAFPSAATALVPEAVAALARRYPEITLDVVQADPDESLPDLRDGRHDLALTYDYPIMDSEPEPELEYELLFEDHLLLAQTTRGWRRIRVSAGTRSRRPARRAASCRTSSRRRTTTSPCRASWRSVSAWR